MGNFFSDTWKDLTQPGWRQADDASKLNEKALGVQESSEAYKQKSANELKSMANTFLLGGNMGPDGAGGFQTKGALPQAQDWMTQFLDNLQNGPDLTYNKQRGQMEAGVNTAKNNAVQSLARRGGMGSGMLEKMLLDLDMNRASGLSSLVGQREDRRTQNLATGAQTTQSLLDRALNMFTGASGAGMGLNTQIPNILRGMSNQALNQNQQPGVVQSLAGTWAKSALQDWLNPTYGSIGPNDVAVDSGGGDSALSSFAKKALWGTLGLN
jgi:hypothetical protein